MFPKSLFLGVCVLTALSLKDDSSRGLPQPRYEAQQSDPAWMEAVVRFHGHLGPSIVAGARLGMAGLAAGHTRLASAQGIFGCGGRGRRGVIAAVVAGVLDVDFDLHVR